MDKKTFVPVTFGRQHWLLRMASVCVFVACYSLSMVMLATPAQAAGVPGGSITDPVVRAVDIAKPAVVRIITTIGGSLTVHFTGTGASATFPQTGGTYPVQLSGSGTFISAHGDILTADHVVKPPHDQDLDQALYEEAAQDVADYVNQNLNPSVPFSANDAFSYLENGYFLSETHYTNPSSKVYLSTDYVGAINATDLQHVPATVSLNVDGIEKDSPVDQKDVAIIHVKMDDTPSVVLGDSSNVEQQDQLTIIGYPGNGDVSQNDDPTEFLTSSVNKIYVSAIKMTDNGAPVIQVGGNVEHGDSGGPALDSNGNIVGIVSFGLEQPGDTGSTSFLQASSSANQLIQSLSLNTTPGTFEKDWTRAFNDYASTQSGHWHKAQKELKNLETAYPAFQGIQPYVAYATTQANHEVLPQKSATQAKTSYTLLYIVIGVVVVVLLLVLVIYFLSRGNRKRPTSSFVSTPAASVQPFATSNGNASPLYGPPMTPAPTPAPAANGFAAVPGQGYATPAAAPSAVSERVNFDQQGVAAAPTPWPPRQNSGAMPPVPPETPSYGARPASTPSSPAWPAPPQVSPRPAYNQAAPWPAPQGYPTPGTPGVPPASAWPRPDNSGPMPPVAPQPLVQRQPQPVYGAVPSRPDGATNDATQKLPPKLPGGTSNPADSTLIADKQDYSAPGERNEYTNTDDQRTVRG